MIEDIWCVYIYILVSPIVDIPERMFDRTFYRFSIGQKNGDVMKIL